ncbi:hypothetical protein Agau_L100911 [Agrobacterium tumefaciens F2]|nr:hypothetical protein Agau_L100911 [Agrobacterium tumefaciens F2]
MNLSFVVMLRRKNNGFTPHRHRRIRRSDGRLTAEMRRVLQA